MSQQVVERPSVQQVVTREPLAAVAAPVLASWGRRLAAFLFDSVLLLVVLTVVVAATGLDRVGGWELIAGSLWLLCLALYFSLCEAVWGQTLGKRAFGIVVRDQETLGSIGYARALGREFFRLLLWVVFYIPFLIDGLWPLWDKGQQTLHDKVARTVVVRVPPKHD